MKLVRRVQAAARMFIEGRRAKARMFGILSKLYIRVGSNVALITVTKVRVKRTTKKNITQRKKTFSRKEDEEEWEMEKQVTDHKQKDIGEELFDAYQIQAENVADLSNF